MTQNSEGTLKVSGALQTRIYCVYPIYTEPLESLSV